MDTRLRIETALERALQRTSGPTAPPRIAEAMHYAIFPGGARVRPRLCLAVARACGEDRPEVTDGALAAIELLHCASLVHDDMPCFDNAATRRGRPSVHAAYDEPTALLVGDALIVLAFETVAEAARDMPGRIGPLVTTIARAVGLPFGIVAGQAWEAEPNPPLDLYHKAKTGSLFVGAAMAGAISAGSDVQPWRMLGLKLGEAYQVADDLSDAYGSGDTGKPTGQDAAHHRPNAVLALGVQGAVEKLRGLVYDAVAAIPVVPGADELVALIKNEATRLVPKELARNAA